MERVSSIHIILWIIHPQICILAILEENLLPLNHCYLDYFMTLFQLHRWWMSVRKYLEGDGCGLWKGTLSEIAWTDWQSVGQDKDSKLAPPEYSSTALPLHQNAQCVPFDKERLLASVNSLLFFFSLDQVQLYSTGLRITQPMATSQTGLWMSTQHGELLFALTTETIFCKPFTATDVEGQVFIFVTADKWWRCGQLAGRRQADCQGGRWYRREWPSQTECRLLILAYSMTTK